MADPVTSYLEAYSQNRQAPTENRRATGLDPAAEYLMSKQWSQTPQVERVTPSGIAESLSAPAEGGLPPSAYVDMPSGEYWKRVISAVPGSAGQALVDTAKALTVNLPETAQGVYNLGAGAVSKAAGALGFEQDASAKAEREAMIDALANRYVQTYGGGEPGSFWKVLAEDPAAIGSDVASLFGGIGLAGKAGTVGKVARIGANLDPAQLAMTGLSAANRGVVGPLATRAASLSSGVPYDVNRMIQSAAVNPDRSKLAAVRQGMAAGNDYAEMLTGMTKQAVDEMEAAASARYMADARNAFAISQEVPFAEPFNAATELEKLVTPSPYRTSTGFDKHDLEQANEALKAFHEIYTDPNPAARTMQQVDILKKDLNRIANRVRDPSLQGRVTAVANSLVDATSAVDPAYAKMMREWSEWKNQLKGIEKDLYSGRISQPSAAKKITKAFSDPYRRSLLNDIAEQTQAGKNIRELIAGNIAAPMMSDKVHTIASIGAGLAPAYLASHPAAAVTAIPLLAASSPRLSSEVQIALARANEAAGKARQYVAGPAVTNVSGQLEEARREAEGASLDRYLQNGPRIQRRAGGRVDIDHAKEAQSLIVAAERAKKAHNGSTEAILHTPDEHVVKALEVANRSI